MRRLALAALALVASAAPAQAGPWAVGRGQVYAKISYELLDSSRLAQPDGTVFGIPQFVKQGSGLYTAWGLSDRVTLIGDVPAWRSSDLEAFGREDGFGDARLGAQVQLGKKGAWQFAARGIVQAPTGDENRAEGLLPTGSGAWEGEGVLSMGRSLAGGGGYGFVEVGYNYRGASLRDGVLYGAQLGWNLGRRVTLAASLRGVEPFSHEARATAVGSPVGLGDRVTYVYYGPTAIVKLSRAFAVQLDVDRVLRARNLATGTTFRGGVSFSR